VHWAACEAGLSTGMRREHTPPHEKERRKKRKRVNDEGH